jgi:hypothetical protein
MTAKQVQSWERTRNRGGLFFVTIHGVLGFGGIAFILSLCADAFLFHNEVSYHLIARLAIQWVLSGFFWGGIMWHVTEKNYQKTLLQLNITKCPE